MRLRVFQAAAVSLVFVPAAASSLDGIAQNAGDLRQTVIGTFLVRNAGTGVFQATASMVSAYQSRTNSETLQRMLELMHDGRTGRLDTIVNEAVAAQGGWACSNYDHLPLRMEGCARINAPTYRWKDASEVQTAAQRLGFICNSRSEATLRCSYKAKFSQRSVQFSILPSIDGEPSGPERVFEIAADLNFDARNGPTLSVTERPL